MKKRINRTPVRQKKTVDLPIINRSHVIRKSVRKESHSEILTLPIPFCVLKKKIVLKSFKKVSFISHEILAKTQGYLHNVFCKPNP